MVVTMFIVGATFVLTGMAVPWMAKHGYKWGIGIKLGGTQSDPELWRLAHLLARGPFVYLGFAFLLVGFIFLFIPLSREAEFFATLIALPLVVIPVLVVAMRIVKKARRQLEEERITRAE